MNLAKEFEYKFTFLPDLKPKNVRDTQSIFSKSLNDNMVHDFNPSRYKFYIEFMKALKEPEFLRNMIYENRLIQNNKEEEDQIIQKINSRIGRLYMVTDKNALKNNELYLKLKKQVYDSENKKLKNKLVNVANAYDINDQNLIKIMKDTFGKEKQQQGGEGEMVLHNPSKQNVQNIEEKDSKAINEKIQANEEEKKIMKRNIETVRHKYEEDGLLHQYTDMLKTIMSTPTIDNSLKAEKLKDALFEIEENPKGSINLLKVTKEDKLVFVVVCFFVRLFSLSLLDWAVNANFVTNVLSAFIFYSVIYILFLLLILVIVNISYRFPILSLYKSQHSLVTILASSLYYFYMIPGNESACIFRFALHFGFIILLTIVILLIKEKENQDEINYDYSVKKTILRVLNNYSLILWFFTSWIAISV